MRQDLRYAPVASDTGDDEPNALHGHREVRGSIDPDKPAGRAERWIGVGRGRAGGQRVKRVGIGGLSRKRRWNGRQLGHDLGWWRQWPCRTRPACRRRR